jgi:mRNA interferase RelE/StbE
MIEVTFTDAAIDDLRRMGPDAVPKVLKKVLILLDSPDAAIRSAVSSPDSAS